MSPRQQRYLDAALNTIVVIAFAGLAIGLWFAAQVDKL